MISIRLIRKCFYLHLSLIIILPTEVSASKNCTYKRNTPPDTIIQTTAGKQYEASVFKKIFLGAHYRKEWTTPVNVKIFDINKIYGGLKPIKQGGSMQTTNLRLEDKEGHEYVIRSVNKTPSRALPKTLRKTLVADIFQDQTSSEHPYGSMTIPFLAKPAGVFYTNPELIYIPFDTSFGEFAPVFANMLAYIEERPNGDMSHLGSSGNSKKVISTQKMFEEIYEDPNNRIDESLYSRTRLFDMLIGDWGRHEDQWRWASYKTEYGKLFKPIPRDRDHVFFKSDGILPYISSRKWGFRKNQNFSYHIKDLLGLNLSATSIDRALLTRLTKKEWVAIADSLKSTLTDPVIENAIRHMPPNIFVIHGEDIIAKLKTRRNDLPLIAEKYYLELSKVVDITGTDQEENYTINRINNSETEVIKMNSKKDTIYRRIFYSSETEEIRIYGLGGDDHFFISGKTKKGPIVRVIGGNGNDIFVDNSKVSGLSKKNLFYDSEKENTVTFSKETKDKRSDVKADSVNFHTRTGYKYNTTAPIPTYEFNIDDGLFLGLGLKRRTYDFKKSPYASYQTIGLNYATSTSALSFRYHGDFKSVVGKWNILLNARINGPKYLFNYFGMGNETIQTIPSITYYRVKAREFIFFPVLYKNLTEHFQFGIGPQYQYLDVQKTAGRFIQTSDSGVDSSSFEANHYVGLKVYTCYSNLTNLVFPTKGIRWNLMGGFYQRLGSTQEFTNVTTDVSFFYTPKIIEFLTFASRVGGATNIGDFQFFQANTLGGTTNLRGYRRTRFYGRTSFFHNIETRIKLADLNFYLFPAKVGIILFYDYGRVWADHEKSNEWHSGYGPGVWMQIHNKLALTGTYGFSSDKDFLNIQLGFIY